MKILMEAAGCLTASYMINSIKAAGCECVASDAQEFASGRFIADDFIKMPYASSDTFIETAIDELIRRDINMVIPTLDDGLLKWADKRSDFEKKGIIVAISDISTLQICLDKWNTYLKFSENGIPTPKTSLSQDYSLVKPRNGRGGTGISIGEKNVNMEGMISQELLAGEEYTVDVFCNINNEPIYIIPRKRIGVKDGKSTGGETVNNREIIEWVKKICNVIPFVGAVNIQCFDTEDGIRFTEINPRFGGGTVLAMKATENWIPITIDTFYKRREVVASKPIKWGLKMGRYYSEVFYE